MNSTLRPMTLGEILDRTFQIFRARFWVFVGIEAAPVCMMTALHMADRYWWHLSSVYQPPATNYVGRFFFNLLVGLAFFHLAILVHAVFAGAVVHQTSHTMFGTPSSLRSSIRFAGTRWRSFLWLGVLNLSLVLIAAELVMSGLFAGFGVSLNAMGLLNGDRNWPFVLTIFVPLLTGMALFLWMIGCCAFLFSACALEDLKGFRALRRSWALSRGARRRMATTYALLFLLGWVLSYGVYFVGSWGYFLVLKLSGHAVYWQYGYLACLELLYALLALVIHPLYPIAVTLFYYDQRIRKEGFDIEWMMTAAGMNLTAAEVAPEEPAPASVPVEGLEA